MKFGFLLTDYFPYGGLQRDCLKIATIAVERGHEVTILTRTWQGEKPSKVGVRLFGRKGLTNEGRNRNFFKQLNETIPGLQLDGVVGFNRMAVPMDVYFGSDPCYVAKTNRLKPFWYKWTRRYTHFKQLEESIFRKGCKTELLLLTEHEIQTYQEIYETERSRFHLLPPGINCAKYIGEEKETVRKRLRKELGLCDTDHLFLFVGSGFRIKGLDRAIRALASLPEQVRGRKRLVVIGQNDPTAFMRVARQCRVEGSVKFLGGREDVDDFLCAADVLIHPAHSESAGMVLLEAIIYGVPVIVTDTCGYAFHVRKSGCGEVIASPFAQDVLNAALLEFMDLEVRERCRQSGLAYAESEDLYSCHEKAVGIITDVCSRNTGK